MRLRPLVIRLHRVLGLGAALFILILTGTGAIMAFEPELERLLHRRTAYVTVGAHRLSLAAVAKAVAAEFPGEPIQSLTLGGSPNQSTQVRLARRLVSVDPYTGRILGADTVGPPDLLARIHQLHLRLLVPPDPGDWGKRIVSWTGVAMLLLLLGGVYLWWPLKRFRVERHRRGWRFWFDVHNAVGILAFAVLLLLTTSGIIIGFESVTAPLAYRLSASRPTPRPDLHVPHQAGREPIAPDSALALAALAIPGATPFSVNVPAPNEAYYVRARFPEDRTPGGRSAVIIDPYDGRVLFAEGSRAAPAGTRAVILNRALHTGDLLGLPTKALASLACLFGAIQVMSGATLWLRRRGPARPAAASPAKGWSRGSRS